MSLPLTVNNTTYFYPEQGDINWGTEATEWAAAVTTGMLQKAGGLFQLLGEVDFGPNYGLSSLYYKSRAANAATTGVLRLANGDTIDFRNYANSANLALAVNPLNQLTFNGQVLAQDSSYINVLDYGAKGDGVTIDSVAIQAAVDAAELSVTKKIVYFPNTTLGYVINAPIVVPAGVTLLGDNYKGGERSRIKPTSGYTGHIIESKGIATPLKQNRINIVGLFLDGSSTTLTAVNLITQESAIINVTIKNCFTYGIRIGGISSALIDLALNNLIQDCYLAGFDTTSFYDAIFLDYYCADNTITATYIENCQNSCIRSRASNDIIENNHLYYGLHLYYSETSDDKLFVGNYLENSDDCAIYIEEGSGGNLVLNGVIANNVFRNINRSNTGTGVIEIVGPNTTSLVVSGNALRRDNGKTFNVDYFIYFDTTAANLTNTNNTKVFGNAWEASTINISEANINQTYLSANGGSFPLSSDVNFGSSYGVKGLFFGSVSNNSAAAGVVRLARTDVVSWRNNANNNDLALAVTSADVLTFNGDSLINYITGISDTTTIDLDVTTRVLTAAVIAGSLTNTHINASAAIAYSKLATLTSSRALQSGSGGVIEVSAVTATELSYLSGVTSGIQTQLGTKFNSSGGTITGATTVQGNVSISTVGAGLRVAEGSNAKMGTSTLVAGTVTVNTTAVTTNSRIFLTSQVDGGTPGFLRVSTRTANTSFTILSSSNTDTSTVAWMIVEPA